jgi:uncharacterized protein Yka (UPF0111/DUF47 family)
MFKSLFSWFWDQLTLSQEVAQLRQAVRDLQKKDEDTTDLLRSVLFSLERESDQWRHEHENLLLRLENELLKFERRLPPHRSNDDEPKIKE